MAVETTSKYTTYPFGMTMDVLGNSYASSSTENPYQYNGKEIFKDFGFNSYNYGARWYDPAVGRFSGVDPLAESFINLNSYNYVANNPILNFDPNGDTIVNHNHSVQFLNQMYAYGLNVSPEKSPFSFGDDNK